MKLSDLYPFFLMLFIAAFVALHCERSDAAPYRFKIHNQVTGVDFQVEQQSDTLAVIQPEWGKSAWTETVVVTPEVRDDQGNVVSPVVTQDIQHPAEYTFTVQDIAAEVAAQVTAQAAVQAADQRVQQIDWSKITTLAQLKTVLQDLIIARKK
jgi:hypothetical protein